jgi:serine/threonine protein kinase
MGSVYQAYDRLTRQMVALKQVSVPTAALQFATSRSDPALALALEFRTLAGLRHPHIVAVLDYGFDAQHFPYYTMQLWRMPNLSRITARRWTSAAKRGC